jgi:3-hydroxyacyl-CoA dehydrogenase
MKEDQAAAILDGVVTTTDHDDLASADIVIEARSRRRSSP